MLLMENLGSGPSAISKAQCSTHVNNHGLSGHPWRTPEPRTKKRVDSKRHRIWVGSVSAVAMTLLIRKGVTLCSCSTRTTIPFFNR